MRKHSLSMLMDLYEMTMANGIFQSDMRDTITYFEMFFRRVPDKGGYAIMAGLEQLIEYFNNLTFSKDDIKYLRGLNLFCDEFLDYLSDFKFECDVWAVPEGTPHLPDGAYRHRKRSRYAGLFGRNYGASHHKPSVSYRN